MLSNIKTMTLQGLDGILITVEIDTTEGLPCWEIVGLPDASIKESRERIKSAIKNSGYDFYTRKYIVNLSPADIRKEGAMLDLPIAVGILSAIGVLTEGEYSDTIFIGELALDGTIRKVNGVLPICIEALKYGIKRVLVPVENANEAAVVSGLDVYGVTHLTQVINFLNKKIVLEKTSIDIKKYFKNNEKDLLDFSEVAGQQAVKRALEVAAAGSHNCLLVGAPGSGKTMMARRVTTILPDLTFEEALQITKIHSIAGKIKSENDALITKRPFRSPHHTISPNGIIGGGKIPKPGEISLAHNGVLFLDELPEFGRNTLEVLRGPLEDRIVTISRVGATLTYPCNFMLIASMNPCPCGYYGSTERECTCDIRKRLAYKSRISGPLLDRIDIQIEVPSVKYKNFNSGNSESSEDIKKRVDKARAIQNERYKDYQIFSNSELTPKLIQKFCILTPDAEMIMQKSFEKFKFSARAYSRILKLARTIADLDGKEKIEMIHITEAIQYRCLDKECSDC